MVKLPPMRPVTESAKFSDDSRQLISEILGDSNIDGDIAILEKAVGDVSARVEFPEIPRADYLAEIEAIRAPAKELVQAMRQLTAPAQSMDAAKLQLKIDVDNALTFNLPTKQEKVWAGQDWATIEYIKGIVETFAETAEKAKLELLPEMDKKKPRYSGKPFEYIIVSAVAQVLRARNLPINLAVGSTPSAGPFLAVLEICLVEFGYSDNKKSKDRVYNRARYLALQFINSDKMGDDARKSDFTVKPH